MTLADDSRRRACHRWSALRESQPVWPTRSDDADGAAGCGRQFLCRAAIISPLLSTWFPYAVSLTSKCWFALAAAEVLRRR